jgi:pimeloyl-ACP methyl ester carboxylesterase
MLSQGKYPFPIEFYYGDSDWMERCSARELAVRRAGGNDIGYRIVEGAGHQIIFENPEGMVGYILGQGV